jgi:excisionase family DNA binding protein
MLVMAACTCPAPVWADAEVMTVEEAALLLRVPAHALLELASAGAVPGRLVGGEWRFSRAALLDWLRGARQDERPSAVADPATVRGRASLAQPVAGERPASPTAEVVALRDQAALLRGGETTLEPGLAYARTERESFPVLREERRALLTSLTARYGLRNELQVTARLPWSYRRETSYAVSATPPDVQTSVSEARYTGDLSLSLLGVGLRETLGRPHLIWSIDSVLPTGPGDRGLGASAILSKSYDPVVLFGGLAYMHGASLDASNPRRQLSRNNWRLTLGYTYAVNDNLALNGLFGGSYASERPAAAGELPAARETHQVQFGLTWMLRRGLFLEPAVAFAVGGASPDMTVSLNIPYTF